MEESSLALRVRGGFTAKKPETKWSRILGFSWHSTASPSHQVLTLDHPRKEQDGCWGKCVTIINFCQFSQLRSKAESIGRHVYLLKSTSFCLLSLLRILWPYEENNGSLWNIPLHMNQVILLKMYTIHKHRKHTISLHSPLTKSDIIKERSGERMYSNTYRSPLDRGWRKQRGIRLPERHSRTTTAIRWSIIHQHTRWIEGFHTQKSDQSSQPSFQAGNTGAQHTFQDSMLRIVTAHWPEKKVFP